jgi:hypothetical protein
LAGRYVDLNEFTPDQIHIEDIAWGLGRTLRYGGHIKQDYHVATHCIVMSYAVPEEHALEALLHDAAEAYMGDIIWPVKALFPQVSEFEDHLLHVIMEKFGVEHQTVSVMGGEPLYYKRPVIANFDNKLMEHECFSFGRPGVWHNDVERAWLKAADVHEQWWFSPTYAYLERFSQLTSYEFDLDMLTELWFPSDKVSEQVVAEAERVVAQMGDMLVSSVGGEKKDEG